VVIELIEREVARAAEVYGVGRRVEVVEIGDASSLIEGFELVGARAVARSRIVDDRPIIEVNLDAFSSMALTLSRYGVPLERFARAIAFHEVGHVKDMLDGLYDTEIKALRSGDREVDELFASVSFLVTETARHLITFRRRAKVHGAEGLAELELLGPTSAFARQHFDVGREALASGVVPLSSIIATAVTTAAEKAALARVVGARLGIPLAERIVDIAGAALEASRSWSEVKTLVGAPLTAMLIVGLNLELSISVGDLVWLDPRGGIEAGRRAAEKLGIEKPFEALLDSLAKRGLLEIRHRSREPLSA